MSNILKELPVDLDRLEVILERYVNSFYKGLSFHERLNKLNVIRSLILPTYKKEASNE